MQPTAASGRACEMNIYAQQANTHARRFLKNHDKRKSQNRNRKPRSERWNRRFLPLKMQNEAFRNIKGHLSQRNTPPFTTQKAAFRMIKHRLLHAKSMPDNRIKSSQKLHKHHNPLASKHLQTTHKTARKSARGTLRHRRRPPRSVKRINYGQPA